MAALTQGRIIAPVRAERSRTAAPANGPARSLRPTLPPLMDFSGRGLTLGRVSGSRHVLSAIAESHANLDHGRKEGEGADGLARQGKKKSANFDDSIVDWCPESPLEQRPSSGPSYLQVEGGYELEGHVEISGAKNSALAILAGTLVCSGDMLLRGVPALKDIRRMCQVLESVGCKVTGGVDGRDTLLIDASHLTTGEPDAEAVTSLRASFFIIGSLLTRYGEAVIPLPGGCNIGARPVDLHIRGLEAMGAQIEIKHGAVYAKAGRGLSGARIYMDYPSVGATETLMMAAALADGETVIDNVAQEPEVVDLADFLNSMGAQISGAGTSELVIKGVKKLGSTDFKIIPDRIEAGTFMCAAAITNSVISLSPVIPSHLSAVIAKLHTTGCKIVTEDRDMVTIHPSARPRPANITTLPYPGFPTDMQAQFMALLTRSEGTSIVRETVFENRMQHVAELKRMGAKINLSSDIAAVEGPKEGEQDRKRAAGSQIIGGAGQNSQAPLWGTSVQATDLRAGAALVIAGMAADGVTQVKGLNHIDRGYEMFDEKLRGLGAAVRRMPLRTEDLE